MSDSATTVVQLKEIVRSFCMEREWGQYHGAKDLDIGIVRGIRTPSAFQIQVCS